MASSSAFKGSSGSTSSTARPALLIRYQEPEAEVPMHLRDLQGMDQTRQPTLTRYVIGFCYPEVLSGKARILVQLSD